MPAAQMSVRQPSHRRLQQLSQAVTPAAGSGGGVVQATIPYRKLTEAGDRLVFIPDGEAFDMRSHPVEDLRELGETSLLIDGCLLHSMSFIVPALVFHSFHNRALLPRFSVSVSPSCRYVMKRNITRANTALLCPRAEGLDDPHHLREVATERLTYRHEMEALARECFPGHKVRLVMAGGPTGEDGVPNGNVFTRMSELPAGIVQGMLSQCCGSAFTLTFTH